MKKILVTTLFATTLMMSGCSNSLTKEEAATAVVELQAECMKKMLNFKTANDQDGFNQLKKDCDAKLQDIKSRIK